MKQIWKCEKCELGMENEELMAKHEANCKLGENYTDANDDDMRVSGVGECPECGEEIAFTIPAMLDEFLGNGISGMVPEAKIRCPECKKVFVVACTVNVELMGEE